jgi:hypothetical protein
MKDFYFSLGMVGEDKGGWMIVFQLTTYFQILLVANTPYIYKETHEILTRNTTSGILLQKVSMASKKKVSSNFFG